MSSILKALKKIESELPEKSEIQFRQKEIDTQKITHKRITDKLRLKKQFFAIFAAIILAAGGGLVLGRKPWEHIPSPAAKTETEHTKPLSRIGKKTADRDLSQKKKTAKKGDEKITAITQAVNKESPPAIKLREKEPVPVNKTESIVPKSLSRDKKKIAGQNLSRKDNNTKKIAIKSGQHSKNRRILSIPVKQAHESGLQLQAIAWSSDPGSRIAVINGRVLREGGSVERVLVSHIGKNEVIFKKQGEEWKQLFRLE
ncbi:MAG: general secretion pathway protein GspB [Desulfobacterales bacterium]